MGSPWFSRGDGQWWAPAVLAKWPWVVRRPDPSRREAGCEGPPSGPDARHAGRPHFLSEASRNHRARQRPSASRMAEGKAGGAAGLFAKQVQKKFSRAQEKVGSVASPGARAEVEGSCCPRTEQAVGVREPRAMRESREQPKRQLFSGPPATLSLTQKG